MPLSKPMTSIWSFRRGLQLHSTMQGFVFLKLKDSASNVNTSHVGTAMEWNTPMFEWMRSVDSDGATYLVCTGDVRQHHAILYEGPYQSWMAWWWWVSTMWYSTLLNMAQRQDLGWSRARCCTKANVDSYWCDWTPDLSVIEICTVSDSVVMRTTEGKGGVRMPYVRPMCTWLPNTCTASYDRLQHPSPESWSPPAFFT